MSDKVQPYPAGILVRARVTKGEFVQILNVWTSPHGKPSYRIGTEQRAYFVKHDEILEAGCLPPKRKGRDRRAAQEPTSPAVD